MYRFEIYQGRDLDWYWRLVSVANGQTIAIGGEGYASEYGVRRAVDTVKAAAGGYAPVVQL